MVIFLQVWIYESTQIRNVIREREREGEIDEYMALLTGHSCVNDVILTEKTSYKLKNSVIKTVLQTYIS